MVCGEQGEVWSSVETGLAGRTVGAAAAAAVAAATCAAAVVAVAASVVAAAAAAAAVVAVAVTRQRRCCWLWEPAFQDLWSLGQAKMEKSTSE